ncbi:MAG: hypothetical protein A2Y62_12590 [Candidatus Fischerbacteria bacterium RBG_13_37_8]|uniref:PKD domain-containing protein n=1 Tax=Candidatus Fischerbacteria bacterium RBG_13_37_8 TaxID=1817863 RepID=A0A1F5VU75_9BACT|nr:MAG: hypothetical protein A2Y62_12590 [Candidatus Fischerbacteria bacterium RBG_13_37_8]
MRYLYVIPIILLALVSCKQVDYTAAEGSTLTITINPDIVAPEGGAAQITVMGQRPSGAPLTDGTVVYFNVNIGRVDPARIETSGGFARTTFISDNRTGTATITASSGAAEAATADVTVGYPEIGTLELLAEPAILPKGGGTSTITARILDPTGAPLSNLPVIFSTTAGTLESDGKPRYTSSIGIVKDKLTTITEATVYAISGAATQQITVPVGQMSEPPTASFTISPNPAYAGQKVYFDATASQDPDGYIKKYEWSFGDGRTGSGQRTSHIYTNTISQTFYIILKVTDNSGMLAFANGSVSVSPVVCQVSAQYSYQDPPSPPGDTDTLPEVGEEITFTAITASGTYPCTSTCPGTTDPNGPCCIAIYEWDFGSGLEQKACPTATHTFSAAGQVTVSLKIYNKQNTTYTFSQSITIYPQQ